MAQEQVQTQIEANPKVVVRRTINAKRERVFEAWTDPKQMELWFLPFTHWKAKTSADVRVGGSYRHEMIVGGDVNEEAQTCAGSLKPGQSIVHEGKYLELTPPEKLVFTWTAGDVHDSRVTVELKDLGDKTELWLTHELLLTEAARSSHTQGWNDCLEQLVQFVNA